MIIHEGINPYLYATMSKGLLCPKIWQGEGRYIIQVQTGYTVLDINGWSPLKEYLLTLAHVFLQQVLMGCRKSTQTWMM